MTIDQGIDRQRKKRKYNPNIMHCSISSSSDVRYSLYKDFLCDLSVTISHCYIKPWLKFSTKFPVIAKSLALTFWRKGHWVYIFYASNRMNDDLWWMNAAPIVYVQLTLHSVFQRSCLSDKIFAVIHPNADTDKNKTLWPCDGLSESHNQLVRGFLTTVQKKTQTASPHTDSNVINVIMPQFQIVVALLENHFNI